MHGRQDMHGQEHVTAKSIAETPAWTSSYIEYTSIDARHGNLQWSSSILTAKLLAGKKRQEVTKTQLSYNVLTLGKDIENGIYFLNRKSQNSQISNIRQGQRQIPKYVKSKETQYHNTCIHSTYHKAIKTLKFLRSTHKIKNAKNSDPLLSLDLLLLVLMPLFCFAIVFCNFANWSITN